MANAKPVFKTTSRKPQATSPLVELPAGETVFREGDLGTEMYIVHEGQIEILKQMQDGPLRYATYVSMLPGGEGVPPRARVTLQDGTVAFPVVPSADMVPKLRCGDTVLLEAQCRTLLYHDPIGTEIGDLTFRLDSLAQR